MSGSTLHLAEQLIARASVTPADAGCQELIAQRLQAVGFQCETIVSGPADFSVTNLWAKRPAALVKHTHATSNTIANTLAAKTVVFAGHTDVVPTGPLNEWHSAPFTPTHRDGKLFGRGSADMKVSLAAFVVAIEEFLAANPNPQRAIALYPRRKQIQWCCCYRSGAATAHRSEHAHFARKRNRPVQPERWKRPA